MFSANVKTFSISTLMIGSALFCVGVGFVASQQYALIHLGVLFFILVGGLLLAYGAFFLSDLMGEGPISSRKLRSRFWNAIGLLLTVVTFCALVVQGVVVFFASTYWMVTDVLKL